MEQTNGWKWQLAQQLEHRWWQRYLKNKDVEGYLQWKAAYWKDLLQTVAGYVPAQSALSVLDAGCGPAGIFMALENNKVTALDPLLDKYRSLAHFRPEKYPWTSFTNLAIESLQETMHYDTIYCINAINHVNDLSRCYDNLVDALKPGGHLIISTDAHRYTALKKIFQWIPGDMLHPVQLDIKEYESLLTGRGLRIVKTILHKREAIFDYYITIAEKTA
ncbi:class I SAM-dependent methyltransferase [Sediminibacterium soli]|uniref:class I SAM-dependent methyltransferase n=1 Tax=Sediminibacterium soli TaxID=2698829 RepID=UPI0013796F1E|nr:class I SAM-dependent methyltransferase [Sediminibacterium soli]NCI45574.1 class I SAM-dependent methyltransferase [Sediminibacterium soli]